MTVFGVSEFGVTQMAVVATALVALGYVLLSAVALLPGQRQVGLEMIRTFFSATLIVLVLVLMFLAGPVAVIPCLTLLALRIGYEVAAVRLRPGASAYAIAALSALSAVLTCAAMRSPQLALALIGVWLLLLVRLVAIPAARKTPPMAVLDMLVFPILPTAILAHGALRADLAALMLAAYILVEVFDSFALLFGKLFGRTQAFPNLSPRKTVEGLLGGGFAVVAVAFLAAFILGYDPISTITTALLVGLLAVAGDLAASRLKRLGGVKDYPVVLKRQGGVLDSLDSWIAAGAGLAGLRIVADLM